MRNAYQVLGISRIASLLEIRRVYRQRVRDCHPDLVGEKGVEIFLQIQKAYEILSDSQKRLQLGELQIFSGGKVKGSATTRTQTLLANIRRMREARFS